MAFGNVKAVAKCWELIRPDSSYTVRNHSETDPTAPVGTRNEGAHPYGTRRRY